MAFLSHLNFFPLWWNSGFSSQSAPKDGDTLIKMLDVLDLSAVRSGISSLVRAIGFGPEADNIATLLISIFFVLVVIGYAAGPKSDTTLDKPKGDDKKDTDKKQ